MPKRVTARVLKGFRDSLPYGPQGEKRRRRIIEKLGSLFELAGFEPIDTPALELSEVLLSKAGGETEKQVYRFQDNGGRDVALRFDLTVPFSRFVVQHAQKLNFPFKRYHIAKVWRGENAQRGRFREFYQCDFDIVGDSSLLGDLQILQIVHNALACLQEDFPALGALRIHVNHRALLEVFWDLCAVSEELRQSALRLIDKAHKLDFEDLKSQMGDLLGIDKAVLLLQYLGLENGFGKQSDFGTELARIEALLEQLRAAAQTKNQGTDQGTNQATDQATNQAKIRAALHALQQMRDFAEQSGMNLHFDPSIARGLDYYTGMVFETFLEDLPSLGSVCSGGRYDQLTQLYSNVPMPGVGGSIGLDRLLAGLEELENQKQDTAAFVNCQTVLMSLDPAWLKEGQVVDTKQEENALKICLALSDKLQKQGIACDLIPRMKKMAALFARAEHSRYLLLLQADFTWQLRDLKNRENIGPEEGFTDAQSVVQSVMQNMT